MLGHATLQQTSTYLNATFRGLQESMRRSDEERTRCEIVAIGPVVTDPLPSDETSTVDAKPLVN